LPDRRQWTKHIQMSKPNPLNWAISGAILALAIAGHWTIPCTATPVIAASQQNKLTFALKKFYSRSMGRTRPYGVVLPPHYNEDSDIHYPVIFFLHGGKGKPSSWIDIGLLKVLQKLYQDGKLAPSIVILPDGNDNRSSIPLYDPDYYDGPYGKVSTLIGKELPTIIKQRYRTVSNPHLWAIGGFSSGGWGAFNIGLRHLDQFGVFFSHIGYFTDSSGFRNSPQAFIKTLPAPQLKSLRIYLDAGRDDEMSSKFLTSTRRFHQTLTRLQVPHEFHTFPGGHGRTGANFGWNYTRKNAINSLSYVGDQFSQAIAADNLKIPNVAETPTTLNPIAKRPALAR
jgi:enterochelin esterase-like enzyme